MKIKFLHEYSDSERTFPKGAIFDIYTPVAKKMIAEKIVEPYQEPPKTIEIKTNLITPRGDIIYKEVETDEPPDPESGARSKGKDS